MSDDTTLTDFGAVPAGWLWGTATAAHQIEGGNVNNDWWRFEHTAGTGTTESSGDACDSWHRWLEDLQLVQRMGLDSYRFSLEWSRIEPADGEFSLAALDHYRQMMVAAQEMGLKTFVTLHHFTTPLWLADMGGITSDVFVERFTRYADIVVQHLGDHMDVVATFNEPNVVALCGYQLGVFPPGVKDDAASFRTGTENLVEAHRRSREVLRAGPGDFPVGLTLALSDIVVHPDNDIESEGMRVSEPPPDAPGMEVAYLMTTAYLEAAEGDDYLGIQTYFTQHLGADFSTLDVPDHWRTTQMGWTFTPEALGHAVRAAHNWTGLPIYVTENGVAVEDDAERIEYYSRSLASLREVLDEGADIRGFFAWSLLDNFEWAEGYRPTFGLVAVDPVSFGRSPKPSSEWYARLVASSRT